MKHQDILDMMTVEEKAALLSGASEWTSRGVKGWEYLRLHFRTGLMDCGDRKVREIIWD